MRRVRQRMIDAAIANGTWMPPSPNSRGGKIDTSKIPTMYEVYVGGGAESEKHGLHEDAWEGVTVHIYFFLTFVYTRRLHTPPPAILRPIHVSPFPLSLPIAFPPQPSAFCTSVSILAPTPETSTCRHGSFPYNSDECHAAALPCDARESASSYVDSDAFAVDFHAFLRFASFP